MRLCKIIYLSTLLLQTNDSTREVLCQHSSCDHDAALSLLGCFQVYLTPYLLLFALHRLPCQLLGEIRPCQPRHQNRACVALVSCPVPEINMTTDERHCDEHVGSGRLGCDAIQTSRKGGPTFRSKITPPFLALKRRNPKNQH